MSRIFQHSGEGRFIKSHVIKLRYVNLAWGFPGGSSGKNLPANERDAGDMVSIPGLERSPGGGHGNSTLIFLPRESHGQRSLVDCSPRVSKSWTPLK